MPRSTNDGCGNQQLQHSSLLTLNLYHRQSSPNSNNNNIGSATATVAISPYNYYLSSTPMNISGGGGGVGGSCGGAPTTTSTSFSSASGISAAMISGLSTQSAADLNTSSIFDTSSSAELAKDESFSDWHPPYPRLCAYHDCHSLAAAWGIGPPTTSLEAARPTGASQAQSPSEDDPGDGKTNALVLSCPAFRNELGTEQVRRLALCRQNMTSRMNATAGTHRRPTLDDDTETWQREHTAAEAGVLEDVSNVYLGGRLCAARQSKIVIEPQDIAHVDYFGTDEHLGPMAISMVRETSERKEPNGIVSHVLYRMIVRISDLLTMRVAVPDEALPELSQERSTRTLMRELLEVVCPQIHFGCLRPALPSPKVEELLLKIDEQPIYTRYKVGVLYCKAGQSTEEQMYNNEHSSPAFDEFLDFLGTRVRLRNFDAYKGGLDTRGDTTGEYSIYTEYHSHEVMFHVSTMLPFTPNNKQQLSRKRHIGNDMVTIIFQEPDALPFSPITVRSHFQHVFLIVRANNPCTDSVTYEVAVSRAKDVPAFGPPIVNGASYQKCAEFHDFLLTKIINAENAVHRSKKFAAMAARTRREALKDLAENYVTTHSNEGPSRIASRFLGGSVKRKERHMPKPTLGANIRGALSWMVDVHDHYFDQRIGCILGVSADSFVLLDIPSGAVLFATPTHSILGWANTEVGLKIFYDHGDMLLLRCCATGSGQPEAELNSLLRRLEAVTNGEEAKELILRKNKASNSVDSLGFHVQEEGVVTDVEMYQTAWKAGLRQGSRIVEIENYPVVTLTFDYMQSLLEERPQIRIMMIAPASDGNPRRGCEDPNCPAVKGQDVQVLTPDTFAKQPLTYHEMFMLRNKEFIAAHHNSPSSNFDDRFFNFSSKSTQKQEQYRREGGRASLASAPSADHHSDSTAALSDRKKNSAIAIGSGTSSAGPMTGGGTSSSPSTRSMSTGTPQAKKFSNSVHDQLCDVTALSELNRTRSDDILGFPTPKFSADEPRSTIAFYQQQQQQQQQAHVDDPTTAGHNAADGQSLHHYHHHQSGGGLSGSCASVLSTAASPLTRASPLAAAATGVGALPNASADGVVADGGGCSSGMGNFSLASERHLSFDDELSKYQWWLQKTLKEKRELELHVEKLKTQLAMEQRAHQATRRELDTLQLRINPTATGVGEAHYSAGAAVVSEVEHVAPDEGDEEL